MLDSSSAMDTTPALVSQPAVGTSKVTTGTVPSGHTVATPSSAVPETSYSSSDDEDDFFDAEDGG